MLKIDHLNLQNRKIFFGLAFGAARLRSPLVSKTDHLAQQIGRFFSDSLWRYAPALAGHAQQSPADTEGDVKVLTKPHWNVRKRGTSTPSHAAVLGSNLLCRLSKCH